MIALPNPTKILYTELSSDNDMTASFTDYVATQDARNSIQLKVREYSLMLCDALVDNFKSRNNNRTDDYTFTIESGRKYHKIMMTTGGGSRSVHAFVDMKTGEVYKPASIKAPAKGVRFNLLVITDREWLLEHADWAGGYLYR
jgi:hypothetical protein